MTEGKIYYCKYCDGEITHSQKKNHKGMCEKCMVLEKHEGKLLQYLVIGALVIPFLTIIMWNAIINMIFVVENFTDGDFYSEWMNFYLTHDFLEVPFEFLYHPLAFSILLAIISFIIIFYGINQKQQIGYYLIFAIAWIITLVIYIFLVIILFS